MKRIKTVGSFKLNTSKHNGYILWYKLFNLFCMALLSDLSCGKQKGETEEEGAVLEYELSSSVKLVKIPKKSHLPITTMRPMMMLVVKFRH